MKYNNLINLALIQINCLRTLYRVMLTNVVGTQCMYRPKSYKLAFMHVWYAFEFNIWHQRCPNSYSYITVCMHCLPIFHGL